ncbi:hypothetical protein D3C87_1398430 [compost metagenome]
MNDDVQKKQDRHRDEAGEDAPAEQLEKVLLKQHIGKKQKIDRVKICHRGGVKFTFATFVGKDSRKCKKNG